MDKYSFFKFFNRDLKNLPNQQIDNLLLRKNRCRNRILDQDSFNMKYPFLNLEFYKSNYFDLLAMNKFELMYHYHFNGKKEKRISNMIDFNKIYPNFNKEIKEINLILIKLIFGNEINFNDETRLYIYLKLKIPNIFLNKKLNSEIKKNKKTYQIKEENNILTKYQTSTYIYDKLLYNSEIMNFKVLNECKSKIKICHIHLKDRFEYNKIKNLKKNFLFIFTCSDQKVKIDEDSTHIYVNKKGGKYGGKLACLKYLNDKKINYNLILFLEDFSFFEQNNFEKIIDEFQSNNFKIFFDKLDYNLPCNKYLEELCSIWKINLNNVINYGFLITKKEVVSSLDIDYNLFFSLLNDNTSIDFNWIINYYNLQHLDDNLVKSYIKELKLCHNSFQRGVDIKFMFEDIFNYLWSNISIEKNFKILVNDMSQNLESKNLIKNYEKFNLDRNKKIERETITNNFLNDTKIISTKQFCSFLSSINNNNVNVNSIFYNLFKNHDDLKKYFKKINLDFESINKDIKKICDNSITNLNDNINEDYYLINKVLHEFDIKIYKIFNNDLLNLTDEKLFEHWILYGFYENRIHSINKFKKVYPEFNKKKLEKSKKMIEKLFKNHFLDIPGTDLYKYEVIYNYIKLNNLKITL